jgi:hypothetical protein
MDSFNLGNVALASVLAETFEVVRNGIPGSVTAVSIDDLTEQNSTVPGGSIGENTVIIYVTKADVAAFAIKDGTVLRVRNRRVRVAAIGDDGDNLNALTCSTAGIKF